MLYESEKQQARYPSLVKGAGLKILCVVLRGFKSHSRHHAPIIYYMRVRGKLTVPLLSRCPLNRLGDYPYDRVQHRSSE